MPGKARVQMKMGVSRRASRSSFSIESRRSVYSVGKAVLTGGQRGLAWVNRVEKE